MSQFEAPVRGKPVNREVRASSRMWLDALYPRYYVEHPLPPGCYLPGNRWPWETTLDRLCELRQMRHAQMFNSPASRLVSASDVIKARKKQEVND